MKNGFAAAAIVAAIVFIIGASMVVYSLLKSKQPTTSLQSGEQATVSAKPFPDRPGDETTNWLVYTGNDLGYNTYLRYPPDFELEKEPKQLIFYKGEKLKTSPNSPIDPYPISFVITATGTTCGDCQVFKLLDITVNGNKAQKAQTGNKLTDTLWIYSTKGQVIKIGYGAHTEADKAANDKYFRQMLDTFNFL